MEPPAPNERDPGQAAAAFWSERLAGRSPALELPLARPRPAQPSQERDQVALGLPEQLGRRYAEFLAREGVSERDGRLAAWTALIHRTTRQADLTVGLFEDDLWGALRLSLEERPSLRQLLTLVRTEAAEARRRLLPAAELQRAARCTRLAALFQVLFADHEPPADALRGIDLAWVSPDAGPGALHFDAALFSKATIERMPGHTATLLTAALAEPDRPLAELSLLTPDERRTLLTDWNDTATPFSRDVCLHELFERRARRCPDAPAVTFGRRHLTYAALDARANRLARHLRTLGVGPGVVVAIAGERSFAMVEGLRAIAKAGGAYLPMDPAYPRERLAFMLEDSGAGVLLTQRALMETLPIPERDVHLVVLDGDERFASYPTTSPASGVSPDDLAYVIYTSGSTGKPKGVVLNHRGRVNNFEDFNRRFKVGTGDALIALASLSFDMCAYDVFGTLAAGATIVLPQPEELKDPRAWARLMQERRVTIWHTAPAMLRMLVDQCEADRSLVPASLRLALLGGDWIPVNLPERLWALVEGARFVSMGGATECSMDSTIYEVESVDPEWRSIPYGQPMANQRTYVLDEDRQPVPALVPGELYLGGIGVAHGYWNRPDLTAERFLPDPFAGEPDARMYRTGDLARWLEDGNLELLGRVDNQVKIRGFRIELGEIEARLRQHPGVREGVVSARPDLSGEKRLVAYFVPAETTLAQQPLFSHRLRQELRQHLAAELPGYMVPQVYVQVDALPLSPNGKVDRKRLPEPDRDRPAHLPAYRAPRDVVEEVVADIWADVLGLEHVGVEDPFLDLGGHSILAAQVQARLSEVLPFEVALRDLFDTSTVAGLAQHLRKLAGGSGHDLEEICRTVQALVAMSDREVASRLASNP
jgi:amino acid adenylation domain-containing protein